MVIAEKMGKPVLKVSMDSESEDTSSEDESVNSENEVEDVTNDDDVDNANSDIDENANSDIDDNANSDNDDNASDENDGEDADAESGNTDDDEEKTDLLMTNEGWADSVAKILGSNKPKNKKSLVLSRAKKHSEIVKTVKEEKPAFEVIKDDEDDSKPAVKKEETVSSEPPAKRVKHDKASIRVKPNVLEKDRERLLSKIATKGVVQLFNAVRNQQKTLQKDLDRNDLSEGKKEKILKKFDKRAFLDTLMGQSKSIVVDEEAKVTKNEVKDEDKPQWSALRDDFMMGAKMKDWDKESVDE